MKRKILQIILGKITKMIIKKYRPKIVAVTGSVGKTSTKNTIAFLLENYFSVRKSVGNLNTEFGVPLVFMGKKKGGDSFWGWLGIIFYGIKLIVFKNKDYPKIVVVEMGADKPGDISYLTGIAKPDISVVTWIGEIPVHLENYKNLDQLVSEKSKIVEVLKKDDYSVLNYDDCEIRRMKEKTESTVVYFGFDESSEVKISDLAYPINLEKFEGITFNLEYQEKNKKIHLPYCYGKSFAFSIAASVACGIVLGIDFDGINPDLFKDLRPEKGRMNLIESRNGFFVLNDTYNASPSSVKLALETMSCLDARRRIIVLGDMKELGLESEKAHQEIGEIVFGLADFLVTVGDEAKKIGERAVEIGFNPEKVHNYQKSEDAVEKIGKISERGDIILIKGSRAMKMEKIAEKII